MAAVHEAAQAERQAMLDTMRDLVGIESGSKDVEGVERIAALVRDRLAALGGKAEIIQPAQVFRPDDTPEKVGPMVRAEFPGSGDKKIMLIAHMDTVYRNGMLKDQPFRIDGDKAYGLGIADDKHGVAAIIHTLALLHKLDFRGYGKITVLINGDEEISSPGARDTITAPAADQDAVFSYEGGGAEARLTLATSGIGAAYLTVQGKTRTRARGPRGHQRAVRAGPPGAADGQAVAARKGLKLNWTVAQAGTNRNVIPWPGHGPGRRPRCAWPIFDALARTLEEKSRNKLLPESKVSVKFGAPPGPRRPPPPRARWPLHGVAIYQELGLPMKGGGPRQRRRHRRRFPR